MKSISHSIVLFFVMIVSCFFITSNASASDLKFFQHQHTVIPADQSLEDVVSISGDLVISGTVRDAVVVVNGDLKLTPSSQITGVVLVIGGMIDQEPGAKVSGDVYNISFDTVTKNSLFIGSALLIGVWLIRLVISIMFIFFSPIMHLVTKGRTDHLVAIMKESPKKVITVGFITSVLIVAVSILLSLTIIGIPIALLLLLIVILSFVVGFSMISSTIGERLTQRKQDSSTWLNNGKGAILLTAGLNIPLFGWVLFIVIIWLSLGLIILWLKNKRNPKNNQPLEPKE